MRWFHLIDGDGRLLVRWRKAHALGDYRLERLDIFEESGARMVSRFKKIGHERDFMRGRSHLNCRGAKAGQRGADTIHLIEEIWAESSLFRGIIASGRCFSDRRRGELTGRHGDRLTKVLQELRIGFGRWGLLPEGGGGSAQALAKSDLHRSRLVQLSVAAGRRFIDNARRLRAV